jgi:hypothetical protein
MSEWWSYSLSDLLMFSARTYFRLFERYNRDVWPVHLFTAAIGIVLVAAAVRGGDRVLKAAGSLLALCWLWVAWAFHAQNYATVNTAGIYFAAAFALEAVLLLWLGTLRGGLAPHRMHASSGGLVILLFGLIGYPLLAPASGRPWTQAEVFGVAPDPTVVATLGVLLLADRRNWLLWPIPLMWCAISGATLWTMRTPYWWILPSLALLALVLAALNAAALARPAARTRSS